MEPANSDDEGKGGSSNRPTEPVLRTYFKHAPWMKELTEGNDLACEEPPSSFYDIPTVSFGFPSFDVDTEYKTQNKLQPASTQSAIKQPIKPAYTPSKLKPALKQSGKQTIKPAGAGVVQRVRFELDKPTLSEMPFLKSQMEPANSDDEGKGGSSNWPTEPVLRTYFKHAPWMKELTEGNDLACEEPPSSFYDIPTVSFGFPSFDVDTEYKTPNLQPASTQSAIKQPIKTAYTPSKLKPTLKQSGKQTNKPAVAGVVRRVRVEPKPTLSVHVSKLMPTADSTTTEPAGTDIKSNTPASKIPLPKTEKTNIPSRIPPPKRTLAVKQSSKYGALKSSTVGGVQKK